METERMADRAGYDALQNLIEKHGDTLTGEWITPYARRRKMIAMRAVRALAAQTGFTVESILADVREAVQGD